MVGRAVRIGLTGGIGSGKSTVAHMLAGHGAALIDADALAKQLTSPGGLAMAAIAAEFGPDMVAESGELNRPRMRQLVFNDACAKARLDAIVHPLVWLETERHAQAAIAAGHACIVFDVPLLVESPRWRGVLGRVVVVDCPVSTQIARVVARNGLPEALIEKIIASQATRAQRLAAADMAIYNEDLSLAHLALQVTRLAKSLGL